jgi:glycosyltransferase involved in cell wall biosynthesis
MSGEERPPCDISVAVFCHNEAARIGACLASIAAAGRGFRLGVTVIANGTTDDSVVRARAAIEKAGLPARIYTIAFADKSNAINQSFYGLRQRAKLHVFVDAYAIVAPNAFSGFAAMLSSHKEAVAATGIAGNGRTMVAATEETLRNGGRLHGQLHAFRPSFLDRLTEAGLFLPIGLYRGDGLLGSMACHDLDPLANPWDSSRIKGTVEAVYEIPRLSPFRPADIRRQYHRKLRQMRGLLENAALMSAIYSVGFAALPHYADEMITAWLAGGGEVELGRFDRPFMSLALKRIAAFQRPPEASLEPMLVYASGEGTHAP